MDKRLFLIAITIPVLIYLISNISPPIESVFGTNSTGCIISPSYLIYKSHTDNMTYAQNSCFMPAIPPVANSTIVFNSAIQNVMNAGYGGIEVSGDSFNFPHELVIPPMFQGFYFHTKPDTIFNLKNKGVGMSIDSGNRCDIQLGILDGLSGSDNNTGLYIHPHGLNAKGQSDFIICHISFYSIRNFNTLLHFDASNQHIYNLVVDNYADMNNAFGKTMTKNATGILFDGKEPNFIQNIKLNINYLYAGHPELYGANTWWTAIKIGNSTFNKFADVDGIHISTEGLGGNELNRSILIDTFGSQGIFDVQMGDANTGIIFEPNSQLNVVRTTSFYNIPNPIVINTNFTNNGMYNATGFFKIQ